MQLGGGSVSSAFEGFSPREAFRSTAALACCAAAFDRGRGGHATRALLPSFALFRGPMR